jgi:anti-anti-sigma factor
VACPATARSRAYQIDQESRVFRTEMLSFRVLHAHDTVILKLAGDADHAAVSRLKTALRTLCIDKPPVLVVDCTEVRFFDSGAISALVVSARTCDEFGTALRLIIQPGSRVERILVVAGLDKYFRTYSSMEDALAGA